MHNHRQPATLDKASGCRLFCRAGKNGLDTWAREATCKMAAARRQPAQSLKPLMFEVLQARRAPMHRRARPRASWSPRGGSWPCWRRCWSGWACAHLPTRRPRWPAAGARKTSHATPSCATCCASCTPPHSAQRAASPRSPSSARSRALSGRATACDSALCHALAWGRPPALWGWDGMTSSCAPPFCVRGTGGVIIL